MFTRSGTSQGQVRKHTQVENGNHSSGVHIDKLKQINKKTNKVKWKKCIRRQAQGPQNNIKS